MNLRAAVACHAFEEQAFPGPRLQILRRRDAPDQIETDLAERTVARSPCCPKVPLGLTRRMRHRSLRADMDGGVEGLCAQLKSKCESPGSSGRSIVHAICTSNASRQSKACGLGCRVLFGVISSLVVAFSASPSSIAGDFGVPPQCLPAINSLFPPRVSGLSPLRVTHRTVPVPTPCMLARKALQSW